MNNTKKDWIVMGHQRNGHIDYVLPMADDKDFQANARLIVEAGTIANNTGLTPQQLAEHRQKLLEICKKTLSVIDGPIADTLSGDQCADLGLYDISLELENIIIKVEQS